MARMNITIFGSGGLGAYYGARFSDAGHHVSFIARGAHLDAIKNNGLIINSPAGNLHLRSVNVTDNASSLGVQDLVIVAVKTPQLQAAAEAIVPLVSTNTMVVPFLNGVEAPDVLAHVLGETCVLGGLSRIFSKIEAPGIIRHFGESAYVEFGELKDSRTSSRCEKLKAAFEGAGVEAIISSNIRQNLWRKLILVSAWGGLGALSRNTMGGMRTQPETRALITACANETRRVAEAESYTFESGFIDNLWQFYDALPDEASTSLSRDWLADRPSELEAWHGHVVRLAEKHGIDVPYQRFIYHALLPRDRRSQLYAQ